ncbi:MAG: hypothetical protein WCB10_01615 [Steroidobacteraceae bacterium]
MAENAKLKRMYAELAENAAIRDVLSKTCRAVREATGGRGTCEGARAINREGLQVARLARTFLSTCRPAGADADFWTRKLQAMGHAVRLIAAQFVKPYVKTNKSDATDAEIRHALRTGQAHRESQPVGVASARATALSRITAQANQIRGFLFEFGI